MIFYTKLLRRNFMCKRKQLKLIGWLGLGLFIGGLGCSTNAFAMERHAVYFDRNYDGTSIGPQELVMAKQEFENTLDAYEKYAIIDADKSKQEVIDGINNTFSESKDDDINYLLMSSHGYDGGIIDFSFKELRKILDRYKGKFVIVLDACHSGGLIQKNKMIANYIREFSENDTGMLKSGEFKKSKYNVFAACGKDQFSYMTDLYGFFMKSYFDSSQKGQNGNFLNADSNQDNIVTASELSEYVKVHGAADDATPVSRVVDPELPVFATNRSTFDFKGIETYAGKDTHFAHLKYNGDHTATLKEGVEMYNCLIHSYFKGIYASILAKDKNGNTLFTKEFKGTDYVQAKEENFSLPEGSTLTLYHAEGTSGRYETSNDKELKQEPGNTYHYMVKNNKLVQIFERRICSGYQPSKCLDANDVYGNLFFWDKQNAANHTFQFIKTDHANVYKIRTYAGKWLAASPKLKSTLNKVTQESQASLWLLKNIGNNHYSIVYAGTTNNYQDPTNQLSELVVTLQEDDSLNPNYGTAPILWFNSGDPAYSLKTQQFQFDPM